MEYEMNNLEESPPVILNIMDSDTFGSDYLGRAVIYLKDANTNFT